MNQYSIYKVSLLLLFLTVSTCFADELKTHYATIIYDQEEQLSKFNKRISVKSLSDVTGSTAVLTAGDEVRYKLDLLVEKIERLLHVCPRDLKFDVRLLTSTAEVQQHYRIKYGINSDYIAFYSPQNKTVFISVNDLNKYVLAHELTHVIIGQYFMNPPSAIIQEILAHFVETHIEF